MPKTQQEIVRLTRDVESGQQVYMQLLNKQQELKITEASTVGDVRIVDPAITQPGVLKPKKALIILGSIILGLMLSIVGVLLRSLFNRGIESPQVLEENGISVYASIPLSEWQKSVTASKPLRASSATSRASCWPWVTRPTRRLKRCAACVPASISP